MLAAITTILGWLPMATGIRFDFRKMALDIGDESPQWWGPMPVAVIFVLGFATLLTLIVVPVPLFPGRQPENPPSKISKSILFNRQVSALTIMLQGSIIRLQPPFRYPDIFFIIGMACNGILN
jgi:hypothetical protein